jgi:hypothetical protein
VKTQIERYREPHVIVPRAVIRVFPITVCDHCGIRVHAIRGGYRHDAAEVREASEAVPA